MSKLELSEIASEFTVCQQDSHKIDEDSLQLVEQSRIDDQMMMTNPVSPRHIRRTLTESDEEEKNSNLNLDGGLMSPTNIKRCLTGSSMEREDDETVFHRDSEAESPMKVRESRTKVRFDESEQE